MSFQNIYRLPSTDNQNFPFQAAVESADAGIFFCDVSGDDLPIVYANRALQTILGLNTEAIRKLTLPELMKGAFDCDTGESLPYAFDGKETFTAVLQRQAEGGETAWLDVSLAPVKEEAGDAHYVIGIVRDITERMDDKEKLRRGQAQLDSLFENSVAYICLKDTEGRILAANANLLQLHGFERNQVIGKRTADLHPDAVVKKIERHEKKVLSGGKPVRTTMQLKTPKGLRDFVEIKFPVRDKHGAIEGIGTIGIDVTEQKRAQDALAQSEAHLRSLFDHANAFIVLKDKDGRIERVNKWFCDLYDVTEDEVIGKTAEELHGPSYGDNVNERDQHVLDTGETNQKEYVVSRPGGIKYYLVHKFPIRQKNGKIWGIGTIGFDITERKRAEQSLHKSEERFRDFSQSASDWFWETGTDHRAHFVSSECEKYWVFTESRGLGKARWELACGEPENTTWEEHKKTLEARLPFRDLVFPVKRPNGEIRKISTSGVPVFDENGNFRGYRGVGQDVTDQKIAEETLKRAHKMEAIGQLTGGVAHDFNNLLTAIIGNLEYCLEAEETELGDAGDFLNVALKAAHRGADLTHRLLAFSRIQHLQPKTVDVESLLQSIRPFIQRTIGEHIHVDIIPPNTQRSILVDEGQLETALLNLAINARDAMGDGGTLKIRASGCHLGEAEAKSYPDGMSGDFVKITVSDTGEGMSPEIIDHVLEPFFTTKDVGKGSGLGLSMVYGFVTQSGGWLNIDSEVGEGTSVELYLPVANESAQSAPSLRSDSRSDRQKSESREKILLVEDDDDVRRYLERVLTGHGFRVTKASDGKDALKSFRAAEDIDLVLTDLVLPGGTSGVELIQEIRSQAPHTKFVMISGYPRDAIKDQLQSCEDANLLRKPFNKSELLDHIRASLDG